MAQDIANIFKLSDDDLKSYKSNPFQDCYQSTKTFAEALKKDVLSKKTPHSLLLEAGYGMGKTFFATRFAQFLNNKGIETIYFSAWELDYLADPFIAFSKAITDFEKSKPEIFEKYKLEAEEVFKKLQKAIGGFTISIPGVSYRTEALIDAFRSELDPIVELRKSLTNFIGCLPKGKLVIIVDELDRCRPDYAMKTLECVKHFFDVEGLFVIFPCNKEALHNCVNCLYSINQQNCKGENYFGKFFNDKRTIEPPTAEDYRIVVSQYVNANTLQQSLKNKNIVKTSDNFNSITTLVNSLATLGAKNGLTFRQLKDICEEIVRICGYLYEPVRCEYLSALMCSMYVKDKSYGWKMHITFENPHYSSGHRPERYNKFNLDNLINNINEFKELPTIYKQGFNNNIYRDKYNTFVRNIKDGRRKEFNTYVDFYAYLNTLEDKAITLLKDDFKDDNEVKELLEEIILLIKEQENVTKEYQGTYGSDDNDSIRDTKYREIVDKRHMLYLNE